jgi:hypothetical protein
MWHRSADSSVERLAQALVVTDENFLAFAAVGVIAVGRACPLRIPCGRGICREKPVRAFSLSF